MERQEEHIPELQGIHLSPDVFRHRQLKVFLLSSEFFVYRGQSFYTRNLSDRGMLVETSRLFEEAHLFELGKIIEVKVFFPFEAKGSRFRAKIQKIARRAYGADGGLLSVCYIQFVNLSPSQVDRLKSHDLIVQTASSTLRSSRFPVKLSCKIQDAHRSLQGTLHDVSMTGAFVECSSKLNLGQEFELEFRLPFQKVELHLVCQVSWLGEKCPAFQHKSKIGFGVKFLRCLPSHRERLASYCAKNSFFL